MVETHGNGEDIVFADAVRRVGGRLQPLRGYHVRTLGTSQRSYSKRHNHYPLRKVIW